MITSLFRLLLAVLLGVCLLEGAVVTPAMLHPGMTRSEADAALPKDYQWQVLSDKTIRRMWRYGDRAVLADFNPQTDQCVFISFVYPKGISMDEGLLAASELVQGAKIQLKKLKASKEKALQMKNADFGELEGGSYIFLEKFKDGRVLRISWYQLPPAASRLALKAHSEPDTTLLGARGDEGALQALMAEERRRQGAAAPGSGSGEARRQVVIMTADGYVPDYDRKEGKPKKRVKFQAARADLLKEKVAGMDPVYWAIGGLVLLLLIGWCVASSRK